MLSDGRARSTSAGACSRATHVVFLHTNDLHGSLTDEIAQRLRSMRTKADLLIDSGDAIRAGNLAVPLRPDPAWPRLAHAGCDIGTLGNRESHPLEPAFRAKLEGLGHPIVCANLHERGSSRLVFPASKVLDISGLRLGVVGAMVPIITDSMATKVASAYLWDDPIAAATEAANTLRGNVDLLVAITHVGFRRDLELAEACPALEMIFGGHSHTVLQEPARVGNTWIVQGGSHGRWVGRYRFEPGQGLIEARLVPLKGDPDSDR